MKNTIMKLKISPEGFNSWLNQADERLSEFKDRLYEIILS
jgi:hypothetical protein